MKTRRRFLTAQSPEWRLWAYYPLKNDTYDHSGNNRHLVTLNPSALTFNGSYVNQIGDARIQYDASSEDRIQLLNNLKFEMEFYQTSYGLCPMFDLFSGWNSVGIMMNNENASTPYYYFMNYPKSASAPPLFTWVRITIEFWKENSKYSDIHHMSMKVTNLDNTITYHSVSDYNRNTFNTTTIPLISLGCGGYYSGRYFKGYMRNCKIWERKAYDPNTLLLLNGWNEGADSHYDSSMYKRPVTGHTDIINPGVMFNYAYDYTGDPNSYLDVQLPIQGDFTIEYWINPHDLTDLIDQAIISNNYAITSYLWYANQGALHMLGDSLYTEGLLTADWDVSINKGYFQINQWYHIAIVGDGTTVKSYVDGQLMNQSFLVTQPNFTRENFRIGDSMAYGVSAPLNAMLAEIRISKKARYSSNFTPPIKHKN